MKPRDWYLPGTILLAWALFCYIYRDFPLWAAVVMILIAIIMIGCGVIVHYMRKWSTKANQDRDVTKN